MCLCYSAWLKWQLGYPDEAAQRAHKVVALATELNHPFSMGEAHGFCTAVHHFRGESQIALKNAERAIEICQEGGFAVWLAHAKLMHGRILAELGEAADGIEEMREAYEMWTATGAVVTRPFYLAQQAEGFGAAGRPDDGLAVLETAYEIVRKYGERYHEAEIRRLVGEFILQSAARHGRNRNDEAERWFTSALELAKSQKFRSMELRSATSLSRLWLSQGRARDAVRILEPAYSWFSEGRNTGDLVRAQALLEELRAIRV
jgi:predicted ATPase